MGSVRLEQIAAGVVHVEIDRPEQRNALDAGLRAQLHGAFALAFGHVSVRAIVLSGRGGHFCAGGDVASLVAADLAAARARLAAAHEFVRLLANAPVPIVAAVEGVAAGAGAAVALWCDSIVAARSSRWSFGFLRVGVAPDYGIGITLPRRVGTGRARELLAYARTLSGEEAQSIGLVDELVDDGAALAVAQARARQLIALPREALRATRQLLQVPSDELEPALALELELQARCLTSPEAVEGRAAFLEKRAPRF